jgi:transcriptional regulator with XRE-family HTH domain
MAVSAQRVSPFGRQLRRWRAMRRMSQLGLAAAAGTTPRYVSFVETGRSRPGRDLVLRMAEVLAVPLPERNALLAAAGLTPQFPEHELGSAQLAAVERVLAQVLADHEPFPAWVVRQPFTFLRANAAAEALFPGLTDLPAEQLIDLWFGPGPFRASVRNWPDVVQAGLAALRSQAADTGDPAVIALLRRAEAMPGMPAEPGRTAHAAGPVVCPVFEFDGQVVATISAVLRFDTAIEVTTSRLRAELMFPADEAAEAFFRAHAKRD